MRSVMILCNLLMYFDELCTFISGITLLKNVASAEITCDESAPCNKYIYIFKNRNCYPAPPVSNSVMKTPPSATRACTSACPAVRRTSTAAPTCRPTFPSRGAPKKPSGSPPYSAPPNSHKMVVGYCGGSSLLHIISDKTFHFI